MKIEAIKTKDGFLIPMNETFKKIKHKKILLELKIIEPIQREDYSVLDKLVGLCETNCTEASINHDNVIYSTRKNNDLC